MDTHDSRSDEDIVSAIVGGDTLMFGELMRRYDPKLRRYGRKFLGTDETIDDVLQESFINAYRNLKSFDSRCRFSPWIYRIAHNAFTNALRAKSRGPIFAFDLDVLMPHTAYDDTVMREREQVEMRTAIERGLSKVTRAYREILILYYLEEFSYEEISDVLKIPIGTVGVRLKRAREAIKKHLDPTLIS